MRKAGATTAILFFFFFAILQGCYSFTGGSLPAHLKTIAIPVFDDRSGAGIAQFRMELARGLCDRIESQSPLRLTPSIARADALLEGSIISFSDVPGQLSSTTERAMTNRITMVVQVTMEDRVKKKALFTQSFVGFADYPAGNSVSQQEAIRFAIGQIVEGIFDRVVSGW
ncbi:MAG: LptE family protein [Chlorobium sp.]